MIKKLSPFCLLSSVLCLSSCSLFDAWKAKDPASYNAVIGAAQSSIRGALGDYLATGNVNWKSDLVQGALGQVRTLEGAPTQFTTDSINRAVGYVITDPPLRAAVTSAVQSTVNAALQNHFDRNGAIEAAATALDFALETQKAALAGP